MCITPNNNVRRVARVKTGVSGINLIPPVAMVLMGLPILYIFKKKREK